MHSSRRSWLAASTTQVLAWTVLLVLSLGLSRLLVVCTGPDCDSQIEFVHTSGTCCDHEPAKCCHADEPGEVAGAGHGGCVDVAMADDTGPLPQRVVLPPQAPACLATTDDFAPPALRACTVRVRPPSTGPPRTDQRTELLASTLLLL